MEPLERPPPDAAEVALFLVLELALHRVRLFVPARARAGGLGTQGLEHDAAVVDDVKLATRWAVRLPPYNHRKALVNLDLGDEVCRDRREWLVHAFFSRKFNNLRKLQNLELLLNSKLLIFDGLC